MISHDCFLRWMGVPLLTLLSLAGASRFEAPRAAGARGAIDGFERYSVWSHPTREQPSRRIESHHFCRRLSAQLTQCALFDAPGPAGRLSGVEYLIGQELYARLPEPERAFWRPHGREGDAPPGGRGQLVGARRLYAKAWHLWDTGGGGAPGDRLPFGPPIEAGLAQPVPAPAPVSSAFGGKPPGRIGRSF